MNRNFLKSMTVITVMMCCTTINAKEFAVYSGFSCGSWIANETNMSRSWLLGYMSGLAYGSGKNVLTGTDKDSIFLWMKNYCNANPLEDVMVGGDMLFWELMQKKGLK